MKSRKPRGNEKPEIKERKSRNGPRSVFIGIKMITKEIMKTAEYLPLRAQAISALVAKSLQQQFPNKQFSEDTVQKRVYDSLLVLKQTGLIYKQKKLYYAHENAESIQVKLKKQQKALRTSGMQSEVKQLGKQLDRLQKSIKALEILKCRNEEEEDLIARDECEKIRLKTLLGVGIQKFQLPFQKIDFSRGFEKITICEPQIVLSGLDLLLNFYESI